MGATESAEQQSNRDEEDEEEEELYNGPDLLSNLEIELVYQVVSYLRPASLVALGRSNKHFRCVLLENEDIWKRYCKEAFGFCLMGVEENANHDVCINKLLYKSWKFHDPENSQDLAKARGYESAHIGYSGASSPAYSAYELYLQHFRYAEEIFWFCLLDASPVVKAYSIDGCLQFFKQKKTKFPVEANFKELLFQLGLWMVSYEQEVRTQSGCCGSSQRVSSMVQRRIADLLTPTQLIAIEDKTIEISTNTSQVHEILLKRSSQDRSNQKLHDKIRNLALQGEWNAIVSLAGYQDENQDLDYFLDLLERYPQTNSTRTQLFAALCEFPHPKFWPKLLELHRLFMQDPTKKRMVQPDYQTSLYDAIAVYQTKEAVNVLAEVTNHIQTSEREMKGFCRGFTATLSSWLRDKTAPDKERVVELLWVVVRKAKNINDDGARYLLKHQTKATMEFFTSGFVFPVGFDGIAQHVLQMFLDKMIAIQHEASANVILEYLKKADCHSCSFICSYIQKVGGTKRQFGEELKRLSNDWNMHVASPAKAALLLCK